VAAETLKDKARRLAAYPPAALVLCACAAALLARRAAAFTNAQFWAEDGHFFERAYVLGARSLLVPYAGYLHAVPRLIALAAAPLDPAAAPLAYTSAAALLTLYVAARTLSPRCPLPRASGYFALAVVLVPDTYEVLLNVVNLQWVLAAGLVLLLVSRDPARPAEWAHDLAAALLLGLTGPFSLVLSPLFAWRAAARRTGASAVLGSAVLLAGLLQAGLIWTSPPSDPGVPGPVGPMLAQLLPAVGRRLGGSLLLGSLLPADLGAVAGTLAGLATLAAVAYLAVRPGPARTERGMIAAALLLILAASLFRTRWTLHEYFTPHSNSRYVFLPQLLALWLLGTLAAGRGRAARIALAVALWCLAANLPRLREAAYPDMAWGRYAGRIREGRAMTIPINPPGWTLTLPDRRP